MKKNPLVEIFPEAAEKCAICATHDAVGYDHVPPKNIFPRPLPADLITVPACAECNNGSSPDDEEFKVGVSLLAGIETPATLDLWQRGALKTLAHNRRLHREVLRRLVKVEVRTEAGIYLSTEGAVLVPKHGIHTVLERTIRGLYFHHSASASARGHGATCSAARTRSQAS